MSDTDRNNDTNQDSPLKSNILDGVASILGRLGELAEKGEELRKQAASRGNDGSESKGVFDFSVKFGNAARPGSQGYPQGRPQGSNPSVRPTKKRPAAADPSVPATPVDATRQPCVDLFEEDDHVLCIAEMPGVREETVDLSLVENKLSISGKSSRTTFSAVLELPAGSYESPTFQLNNGILEVNLVRHSAQ